MSFKKIYIAITDMKFMQLKLINAYFADFLFEN
jgi:hypothetical protein